MEPAGGVEDDIIVAVVLRMGERPSGDLDRVALPHLEYRNPSLLPDHLQLGDGGRTIDVTSDEEGAVPLALQHFGQFGGMGGLTRTLQAAHHDGTGRTVCRRQARRLATHQGGQLFIDDLDHHLGGGEAFHDLASHRPLGDGGGEILGHFIVHVRFQEG